MASGFRRAWLGLAGGPVLLLIAACGGRSDGSDPADDQSADQDGLTAYVECLAEQGIEVELPSGGPPAGGQGPPTDFPTGLPTDFPSGFPTDVPTGQPGGPGGPGGFDGLRPEGVDDETWQAAQEACQSLLPSGGFGPPGGGDGNPGADAAYRNCLADRGIDLTEADNTADPAVAEALAACEVLRPTPTPTS
jgi:hypothetical protein